MATLSMCGRISGAIVDEEIERLRHLGGDPVPAADRVVELLGVKAGDVDPFDRAQLARVLEVCARWRSLSDAGRTLFSASRGRKSSTNDADRLRKYLACYGLDWQRVSS
jgi:transcriptional regulatory protein RtcR